MNRRATLLIVADSPVLPSATAEVLRSRAQPGRTPHPLYQIWDALLFTSGGEGFELPPWEVMSRGVPSRYTNCSSHAEFLGDANAGLPTGGLLQPEPELCIWRMIADVEQAIGAARKLYFDRALARALGANGTRVVHAYAPGLQAQRWHTILQNILAQAAKPGECAS